MSITLRSFSNMEVTLAAGMTNPNLQNHLRRGYVTGAAHIEGAGTPGKHRRFPFHSVMEIGAAECFIRLGIGPRQAFAAAFEFAYNEVIRGAWVDAGEKPKTLRHAGFPFPGPETTLLMMTARGSKVIRASELFPYEDSAFINVSALFDRVVTALGGDPTEELRNAYPQEAEAS